MTPSRATQSIDRDAHPLRRHLRQRLARRRACLRERRLR